MAYRIGVDIGGSFTDFAVFDETSKTISALKVFSRPDQPGAEVLEGMTQLQSRYGIMPEQVSYFTHGTTVGINTVIQRKGLRLGLFATDGFVDVLELARLKIPNMYDLFSQRPAPLVTRDRVFPIDARMDAEGAEIAPLNADSVRAALRGALAKQCEGVVVSLLHAYRNPAHELAVREIAAAEAPGLPVFLSHEVWPIIREYERTITATISGYVQPKVAHYLERLQATLKGVGVTPEPRITKSNGGVMAAEQGKSDCVQMIFSGTASGVIGAAFVARTAGVDRAMSIDIGGTSADVALILDGKPQYGVGEAIGEFSIFVPSVSVSSIGEGGGSIAWLDSLNVLKVGPESAGSTPGPACYGRGGVRPTVTDSFVVCKLLGAQDLGYNAVKIDRDAACKALQPIADRLQIGIEQAAQAVQEICVSSMYAGISGLVSRFGIDPREFTMIAFGGAGPMLAGLLAREMKLKEVLVPPTPGVLSALGGLVADLKNDFIKTIYHPLNAAIVPVLQAGLDELRGKGMQWLSEQDGFEGGAQIDVSADLRYAGQSYEIETVLDADAIARGDLNALAASFHARHEQMFGHADKKAAIQVINLRLVAGGPSAKPVLPRAATASAPPEVLTIQSMWLDSAWRDVPIYLRAGLLAGHAFDGPAVVAQADCTTVIPPGCACRVDEWGNLRIAISQA